MANTLLSLYCVVDGEASPGFYVEVDQAKTVDHLKKAIKTEKSNDFSDVDANNLTLWLASIPNDGQGSAIKIDVLGNETELKNPMTRLSTLFPEGPDENTSIIVQRPQTGNTGDFTLWDQCS